MKSLRHISRLFVAMMFVMGSVPGVSAQTMGSTLVSFNLLANPAVTLTGFGANPLVVNRVGTSPGITLTTTDASATNYHANDTTAVNGMAQGNALWNDLLAPGGAAFVVLPANTLDPAYLVGAGVTVFTRAGDITETNDTVTITGTPTSIVIFHVDTAVSLTNFDVLLVGGIEPANVYWRVTTAVDITNDDAATRSVPGTFINNTAAQDIAIVCSGAGGLNVGRFVSLQGSVSVTQSGAGVLAMVIPAGGPGVSAPGCTDGLFYPSPATGAVGTFSYCMAAAGDVKIRVYNAIGDLAVKVDDTKAAGAQTSTINTARLAPGVYLYILERAYNNGDKTRSKVKKFVVKH
ncbi:MAG: T9SS type A sorting domain-containing protein [Elusimicrobiota bacterium]|nr:T9SS type A sorting domain-containing protein [Elusimicrobiota bacterium]